MSRRLLIVVACLVLPAAAAFDLFDISEAQERRNTVRWAALPVVERDRLRAHWKSFSAQPIESRRQLVRREAVLRRLQGWRDGAVVVAARGEIERDLKRLKGRVAMRFGLTANAQQETVSQNLRENTKRRIEAFLINLVRADRLQEQGHAALTGLPWDDYVRRALELQKREEIYLAEVSDPNERLELEALEPLDVIGHMRERRRLRGFLGEAGKLLGLDERELQQLGQAPDDDFMRVAKRLMAPKARVHLQQELGMSTEQIEEVLALPYRDLERSLHRLVREGR